MTNKKRKGFTIVELVIVIAVIAILAGVLIPTFASIIDKANQSTDIQAVRQMNVLLKAESVEDKPTDVNKVIKIVSEAGYDTVEKRTPKSKDHGFYWHSDTNTIILVKTTNPAELIYPLDNEELKDEFDDIKAAWADNHDGFEDLAVEGKNATPVGTAITKLSELKDALENENDGEYYLDPKDNEGNQIYEIALTEYVTVYAKVTIDLNGKTLILNGTSWDDISVNGTLNIENSGQTGGIIINKPANEDHNDGCGGIYMNGGTLNLNGVNVEGNRKLNIYNSSSNGNYYFTDITYTVKSGNGLYIGNGNEGETIIDGCEFITSAGADSAINSTSGSTTISNTTFSGTCDKHVINWTSSGTLNLEDIKINPTSFDEYNGGVFASNGNVKITEGTYNCSLSLTDRSKAEIEERLKYTNLETLSETEIAALNIATFNGLVTCCGGTIYGGTFNDGVACNSNSNVTINGGTFTKKVTLEGSGGKLNITGGTFKVDSGVIVYCEGQSVISITGGKFQGIFQCSDDQDVEKPAIRTYIRVSGGTKIFEDGYYKQYSSITKYSDIVHGTCKEPKEEEIWEITMCLEKSCEICEESFTG